MKYPTLLLLLLLSMYDSRCAMPDDKDMLYEYRIARLNEQSPVALDYNEEVRKYIDLFTGPR